MTKNNIIAITLLIVALFITIVFNSPNVINLDFSNIRNIEEQNTNENHDKIDTKSQEIYYPIEIANRYYYNQLDENAKIIYTYLEKNIDNLKTGTYTIDFGTTFNSVLQQSDGKEILIAAFENAMIAFFRDMPEVFYIDSGKMGIGVQSTTKGTDVTYEVSLGNKAGQNYYAEGFNSKEEVEEAINKSQEKRKSIINNTTGSTYERILQVHDYLVDNIEYDVTMSKINAYNIYGALIEKTVVCKGYAETFKYILDGMGIPCIVLSGTGIDSNGKMESHAWNYVKINGVWYAVDVTWDDAIIMGEVLDIDRIKYRYFLKGSNSFSENHITEGKLSDTSMEFTYPELNLEDYIY